MPGDTIRVAYNAQDDTYELAGDHATELSIYKIFSESKFSVRNLTSPVPYSPRMPLNDFIHTWHSFWKESEQMLVKVKVTPNIRPEIKAHLVLEARLRTLHYLFQPASFQTEAEISRPLPRFYQDTVSVYEKKLGLNGDAHNSCFIVSAHRSHAILIAERENKISTLATQYQIAKRDYTGYQREWTCYALLKDMFLFNRNIGLLPMLIKDYRTWSSPNSLFVNKLLDLTKSNDIAILANPSMNENLINL